MDSQELSTIEKGGRILRLSVFTPAGGKPLFEMDAKHNSAVVADAQLLFSVPEALHLRSQIDRYLEIARKEK